MTERSTASRRRVLSLVRSFHWIHILSWIPFFPGLFVFSFYAEIPTAPFLLAFLSMPIGVLGALAFGYQQDRSTSAI